MTNIIITLCRAVGAVIFEKKLPSRQSGYPRVGFCANDRRCHVEHVVAFRRAAASVCSQDNALCAKYMRGVSVAVPPCGRHWGRMIDGRLMLVFDCVTQQEL